MATLSASTRLRNLAARHGTGFSAARIPADDLVARALYWGWDKRAAAKERDRYWPGSPNFDGYDDASIDAEAEQRKAILAYLKSRKNRPFPALAAVHAAGRAVEVA